MNASDEYRQQLLDELKGGETDVSPDQKEMQELAGSESKIACLIDVLNDKSSSADSKQSALDRLDVISVFSPVLPRKMPDYVNALRGLMDDDDSDVRIHAYGRLAAMKDEVAQERLQSELQSDKPEADRIVPTHQAIGMLGFDEKSLDYGVLRKIAENPPSERSLVAAIRHLPADSESYVVLKGVMEDDSRPLEARSLVPDKISNVNPRDFLASVEKMLKEKGSECDLAPYLARGVGGIEAESVNRALEARSAPASTTTLNAEIEKTKSVFKELLPDSPESFNRAANAYLFSGQENGK